MMSFELLKTKFQNPLERKKSTNTVSNFICLQSKLISEATEFQQSKSQNATPSQFHDFKLRRRETELKTYKRLLAKRQGKGETSPPLPSLPSLVVHLRWLLRKKMDSPSPSRVRRGSGSWVRDPWPGKSPTDSGSSILEGALQSRTWNRAIVRRTWMNSGERERDERCLALARVSPESVEKQGENRRGLRQKNFFYQMPTQVKTL